MAFKDTDFISQDDHELNYVLRKYKKRQTTNNSEQFKTMLKAFRQDDSYKPHKRQDFYRYIDQTKCFNDLEDKK